MPDKCHIGQCSYYFGCRRGFGSVIIKMMCNKCSPRGFYGQDNICIIILQYWNGSFRGGWGTSLPEKWLLPSTNWLLQHKYDILGEGDLLLVVMDSCYHTIFLVSGYCGVHPSELSLCFLPSLGFVRRTQSCLWCLIPSQTRKWSWCPSSGCWEEYLQLYGGEGRRGERDKLEGGSYLHMYVTANTFETRSRLQASSLWCGAVSALRQLRTNASCDVERTLLCLYH